MFLQLRIYDTLKTYADDKVNVFAFAYIYMVKCYPIQKISHIGISI